MQSVDMVRTKVKLEYITDDNARKQTLKKRKKGMLKKLDELTTLCGVEGCAIVYDPPKPNNDADDDHQPPEIWPSQGGVHHVLSRFAALTRFNQTNKMFDQEAYLKDRIKKTKEQLVKKKRENRESEMTLHINHFLHYGVLPPNLDVADLNDIAKLADRKIKEVDSRLEQLKKNNEQQQMMMVMHNSHLASSSSPVPPAAMDGTNNDFALSEDASGYFSEAVI